MNPSNRRAGAPPALDKQTLGGYLSPLLSFVRRRVRLHEALGEVAPGWLEPEEIADAVLAEALERTAGGRLDGALYPWLRRLARQAIEREVRRARQQRALSLEQPLRTGRGGDPTADEPPRRLIELLPDPSAPVPEAVVESEEFQRELARLLGQLPDSWSEPFLLHTCDGRSLETVAQLEGLSPEETQRRIDHVRQLLRARLAEEYELTDVAPPSEQLFAFVERRPPTPAHHQRLSKRLAAASQREGTDRGSGPSLPHLEEM